MMRVLRYVIPVDDAWHDLVLSGPIVHVASRSPHFVEIWVHDGTYNSATRTFRVFGTGYSIEPGSVYTGTTITTRGEFVWHLFEKGEASDA